MPEDPNRILIVEDDAGLAERLGCSLKSLGLCVDVVGSGRECISWLPHHGTDLLLVDYSLPDMTGAALVDELRGTGGLCPFIVITGHGDTEVAVRLMKLGALDCLVKDARLPDLLPEIALRALDEIAVRRRLTAAESALQENERRYRQLLASVTDYLYSVRIEDGRPVATSHGPGCKMVTGYVPEEYASDSSLWIEMVHPEDRAAVVEHAQAGIRGERRAPLEHRIRHKDGSLRWVQCAIVPRRDSEGRLVAVDGIIVDITKRKEAEEALRLSEEHFRRTFDLSPVGAVIVSTDFRFLHCNEAFCRFVGYAEAELQQKTFLDVTFPGDLQVGLAENRAVLAGQLDVAHLQKRYLHCSGRAVWGDVSIRLIRDAHGHPLHFLTIVQDITAPKQAHDALARDEAELAAIHDHAPVMMLLIGDDLKVRRLNRAALEFAGKTPDDSIGLRPGDMLGCLHALDDPRGCGFGPDCSACLLRNSVLDAFQTGATRQRIETQSRFVRGREVSEATLLVSASRVTIAGESMVLLCLEDVSQRKLAEKRVHEQAALLDVTRDAIVVSDLDGVVTYWNHGAEQLYGWPKADAIGRPLRALIFDEPPPAEVTAALQAVRQQGEWRGELPQRSRSGNPILALCRGVLMDGQGGGDGSILFTASDITEAKRIEEQFLRARRLDSLGSLAGGVAHDLNNVFTPIMMSIEMLGSLARETHDQEMVQLLGDSTRRGADIVRQLLLFSRGSDSPRTGVNLTLMVTELRRMMQETFPKNIALSAQAPADLWSVHGDQTQLHQVLLNLCINARDAMPQGGRLAIAAANVQVDGESASRQLNAEAGPHVFLRVTDTGAGISPEHVEKIFDPFFTTKPLGQGTGLGLSTALGIVRSHGGFITVKSRPGAGSEFGIYLPAKISGKERQGDNAVRQASRGQGEFILMMDDEANIRTLVERALRKHGYEVASVCNGAEAVSFVASRGAAVRLVITDVMMPTMDGLQAVRELRRIHPGLPVVVITGSQENQTEFDELPPPRIRHLAKPFSINALLAIVREALDDAGTRSEPARPCRDLPSGANCAGLPT